MHIPAEGTVGKFVKVDVIRVVSSLTEIHLDASNQLHNKMYCIGFITRQKLLRLESQGNTCISSNERRNFYKGVRRFNESAIDCIKSKFPL